jgi:ribose 5-phosphate isomerase B
MTIPDSEVQQIVQRVVARLRPDQPSGSVAPANAASNTSSSSLTKVVAIGADHGGFALKGELKLYLQGNGYEVLDLGTHSTEAVDYPDIAEAVARKVASGEAWRGIVIDGAGIGSCMAANKVAGVRAAMCYDHATAVNSREHNDANVLTLGAGLIGPALAKQIANTWLLTEFGGGRHAKRVEKITALESHAYAAR